MALKATIFKADINIADMDRHYYADHNLTIARHPSENDLRMMARVVAFIVNASETLSFTKGLSTDDEPDLWQKSLSDEIELWVELGQPDEKRLKKACGRAKQVKVYTYQAKAADIWYPQIQDKAQQLSNLEIFSIQDPIDELTELCERNMKLSAILEDHQLTLTSPAKSLSLTISPRTSTNT